MSVTPADITALRQRHQRLVTQQAELTGRRDQLASQQGELEKRMREEFAVDTIDELRDLLAKERTAADEAYASAERNVVAAEEAMR